MKTILFNIITLLTIGSYAQNVYIPDANFRNYLLSTVSVNSNLDTAIQVSEANAFNGLLDVNTQNISDLTGIEAFINMTGLLCYNNQLTTLDMSNSPNLTLLGCGGNQLTAINISSNTNLTILGVNFNQLTTLDVTNNVALTRIDAIDNLLSTINLNNNINLNILAISKNNIANLNLGNLTNLQQITFENDSAITALDLSNNPNLQGVWLDSNVNLASLNLKNGNNTGIFVPTFQGNPSLTCIQVDDTTYANANWTNKDAIAFYSTNCGVGFQENKLKNQLFSVYPNPAQEYITIGTMFNNLTTDYQLNIIALSGKIVLQQTLGVNLSTINIASLKQGYYTIIIKNKMQVVSTKKLIILK